MALEFISKLPVKAIKEVKLQLPKVPSFRLLTFERKLKEGTKKVYIISLINGASKLLSLDSKYVTGVQNGKILVAQHSTGYKVSDSSFRVVVDEVFVEETLAIFGDKTELEVELVELEDGTKYLQTKDIPVEG